MFAHAAATAPSPSQPCALVLAGGDGTRLQSLTRAIAGEPIPKQYCRILGDRSMLEATLDRIAPLAPRERTYAVVNRAHMRHAVDQLAGVPLANRFIQPGNRDTGPGMLLSLLRLRERTGDAIVAVFPSDHFVADAERFQGYVSDAVELVQRDPRSIVLLGIQPDRAETGYGYIEPAERVHGGRGVHAFRVAAFWEKPTADATDRLVRRGGLWSSFVMVFRLSTMLEHVAALRPRDHALMEATSGDPDRLAAHYDDMAPWNFSRDVLAPLAPELVVLRAEGTGWSDWGTPESIERTLATLDIVPPWRSERAALAS